eukprot:CAMPEP_0204209052 /NCGR_PEP_ID=MMETSP0361-20130328/72932_1 /ASSEMBLY_ACC=CAM_ASM_000343 /TAXON_ID=268821 /ORGANISM="Scrippsiella Hangoei, Strain SHTV-5" /LENGTH=60 /DNA_ID=CAMNT_0051172935 /DNA_START=37 /DNA_END=216 /DNA_ORIENTATION=+
MTQPIRGGILNPIYQAARGLIPRCAEWSWRRLDWFATKLATICALDNTGSSICGAEAAPG